MARLFLKSYLLLTVMSFSAASLLFSDAPIGRNLGLLTPGKAVSLRLKDDQVIADVELQSIDQKSISYKKGAMAVKIDRDLVFRARQGDAFYSDLALTAEDHARFGGYVDYINERGDIIVDTEDVQYIGVITGEDETVMTIRTRSASYDVEKRKIAAWRRGGVWSGDENARQEPKGSIFGMQPYLDKKRTFNYALMLSGPWSVLPQFGLGLSTNVNWPVFGGVRGSLGYILVDTNTFGMMAQASAYLNVNLIGFGASRLFAGSSYIWRGGMVMDYAYGSTGPSYRGSQVNGTITQNTYSLHLGLKYKNLMFEGGVEMPISSRQDFERPMNPQTTDLVEIERGVGRVKSSLDTFEGISRVYANISLMF
ncbi:hypothetical protein [Turneriella parva]|uniref:Outer membrane protein beta-barrel domain-containing protein n=1 Tax=Turneriella parva (strain ATCC BAA-1111 / DSM 21527 / NCTC 11395 / H) TaxID=869212 RepID=I4B534_TURPD|nr:hypothetical protein [Turneriella parva]AFM12391.1 hypothetical protein Turpa_1744 [Turneriella parva DSM 21527]